MVSPDLRPATAAGIDRPSIRSAMRRALEDWRPPLLDRRFWAVQGLVMLLAVGHGLIEASHALEAHASLTVVPPALFLIPVVYSAVYFGLRGSLLTALWACLLVIPNLFLWHEGVEVLGEASQMLWIVAVAVFVGIGVDREREARRAAESRERAWRLSEARYRSIFDAAAEPILVLDPEGRIEAANTAAARLFAMPAADLRGRPVAAPLDGAIGALVDSSMPPDTTARAGPDAVLAADGRTWVRPIAMSFVGVDGRPRTQVMLQDVTASRARERGLQEIARRTLMAREEEGQRIARELHDGPIQDLVAMWRRLDELEPQLGPDALLAVRRIRSMAEDVARDLRRVSRDLRPSILDDLGVGPALSAEADAHNERGGLAVVVSVTGTHRRLDPLTELTLLRIGQEALRNVERHAAASRAEVHLRFSPTEVALQVDDDGRGLIEIPSVATLAAGSHLGLIGMRERARLVGARLELGRSPLGGLRVEVHAPAASDAVPPAVAATG